MPGLLDLCPAARFRLTLVPESPLELHQNNATMFRGALGAALHRRDVDGLYRELFDDGPVGRARAYRFRADLGVHGLAPAGQPFRVDLDLFAFALGAWGDVLRAFEDVARAGLGEQRVPCRVVGAHQALPDGWRDAGHGRCRPSSLGLLYPPGPVSSLLFVSPTAFKSGGRDVPPTARLVRESARRRLSAIYGIDVPPLPAPADPDARDAPDGVWRWQRPCTFRRRSRRAGLRGLGGWLGDFAPHPLREGADVAVLLDAAAEGLGVGRHVVLGLGDVRRVLA